MSFGAFIRPLLFALHHDELDTIYLRCMISLQFFDDFAELEVPNDETAILGSRSKESVALGNGNVDDHILVSVEGSLQD